MEGRQERRCDYDVLIEKRDRGDWILDFGLSEMDFWREV